MYSIVNFLMCLLLHSCPSVYFFARATSRHMQYYKLWICNLFWNFICVSCLSQILSMFWRFVVKKPSKVHQRQYALIITCTNVLLVFISVMSLSCHRFVVNWLLTLSIKLARLLFTNKIAIVVWVWSHKIGFLSQWELPILALDWYSKINDSLIVVVLWVYKSYEYCLNIQLVTEQCRCNVMQCGHRNLQCWRKHILAVIRHKWWGPSRF